MMDLPLYKSINIPERTQKRKGKPSNAHAGLWFERFFNGFDKNNDWQIPKPDDKQDVKRDWINQVTGYYWTHRFIGEQSESLKDFAKTQTETLRNLMEGKRKKECSGKSSQASKEIRDSLNREYQNQIRPLNNFVTSQKILISLGLAKKDNQIHDLNKFVKDWEKFLASLTNQNLIKNLHDFCQKQQELLNELEQDKKLLTKEQQQLAESLTHFVERQRKLVSALNDGKSQDYETDWHFVTGMGNPHPVENGFSWHPTLGVPYLASSAVKGLIRAWVEINDEDGLSSEQKQARIKAWFGTEEKDAEKAGNFIFFDAIPTTPPELVCDIMTPHMGDWYEQGDDTGKNRNANVIPADWHEPVPVPFLTVKKACFMFSIAPRRPKYEKELTEVFKALTCALKWLGAGAKTAAGYGQMTWLTDAEDTKNTCHNEQESNEPVIETNKEQISDHVLSEQASNEPVTETSPIERAQAWLDETIEALRKDKDFKKQEEQNLWKKALSEKWLFAPPDLQQPILELVKIKWKELKISWKNPEGKSAQEAVRNFSKSKK